jgi:hypothetical protein
MRSCARYSCLLALLSALAAAPVGAVAESPDVPELPRRLPPGAASVTWIPAVPELRRAVAVTPFHALQADSRFQSFLAPILGVIEPGLADAGPDAGGSGATAPPLHSGGWIVAEYPRGGRVTVWESPAGEGQALLEILLASAGVPGSRVNRSTEPIAGHPVVAVQTLRTVRESIPVRGEARRLRRRSGQPEVAADPEPLSMRRELTEEFYAATSHFVVHAAGGRRLMAEVLRRLDPPPDAGITTLADEAKWRGAFETLASRPAVVFYRDFNPDGSRGGGRRGGSAYRFGAQELRSLAGGIHLLEDRLSLEVALYIPEPRVALGKLLFIHEALASNPADGLDGAALVPADVVAYSVYGADLAQLWTEAYRLLQAAEPDIAQLLDLYFQTQGPAGGRGTFASSFAAHFGSRWITFSRVPIKEAATDNRPEMTVMIGLRDAAALAPALDAWLQNLARMLNLQIDRFTVSGRTHYSLKGADGVDPRLMPLGPIQYVCLHEHWLMLSARQEHVLAALARLSDRAPAGADALPAAAPLFHDPGYIALQSSASQGHRFLEAYAKPGSFDQMMASPLMILLNEGIGEASNSLVDPDQSPREDVWRRRLGSSGFSLRSTEHALVADLTLIYAANSSP